MTVRWTGGLTAVYPLTILINNEVIFDELVESPWFAGISASAACQSLASRNDSYMCNECMFSFRVTTEAHQEEEVLDWLGPAAQHQCTHRQPSFAVTYHPTETLRHVSVLCLSWWDPSQANHGNVSLGCWHKCSVFCQGFKIICDIYKDWYEKINICPWFRSNSAAWVKTSSPA